MISEILFHAVFRLQGPASRSVQNFSSLLPQISTIQPIQKDELLHTGTHSEPSDNKTTSTAIALENDQSVVISEEDQSASDKGESLIHLIDGRRFSMGIGAPSNQIDEHVADEELSVHNVDSKVPDLTEGEDILRHSLSLPQITYTSEEAFVVSSAASREFKKVMKEVRTSFNIFLFTSGTCFMGIPPPYHRQEDIVEY